MDSVYLASGGAQLEVRKQRAQEQQANRQLDISQQGANDSTRRSYLDEIASRQNIEANKVKMRMVAEEEARRKKQAALAEMVFKSESGSRLSAEGEDDDLNLASKYLEMAKKIASVDPQASNDYFKLAQESKTRAQQSAEANLKIRGQKLQAVGDVAAGVYDTDSANKAAVELAKLNKQVPPEVLDFNNPQAKDWWKRQAQFSDYAVKANELALANKKFDSLQEDRTADNLRADKAQKIKEQKLELDRENVKRAHTNKVTNPTEKQLSGTIEYMANAYTNFGSADKATQRRAAGDVEALTLQYMKENNMPQQQARMAAEKKIDSLITEEGVYTVPTENVERVYSDKSVVSPKTQAEFAALPSGTLYINPKDGKQYRKK